MEFVVVPATALAAALLTLVSGFGLGTLLLPAFALYFPLELAIGMTAIVHLANNLFKLALFGKHADRFLVIRFGLPAAGAALLGAAALVAIGELAPWFRWSAFGTVHEITPLALAIAALMLGFAFLELRPPKSGNGLSERWLPIGGALSGFLGGFSGHQGALRSAFLLRFKQRLTAPSFIGTNVVIACLVDVARIALYGANFDSSGIGENGGLLLAASSAAFLGVALGARLVPKLTLTRVAQIVAFFLVSIALLIGSGVLSRQ